MEPEIENEHYMKMALDQAREAYDLGEFPVGCVIVYRNRILVTGARTGTTDGTANETDHAEMVALRRLAKLPRIADPSNISLYCTMEPCLMCYGAILLSGIGKIVYAYEDVMGGGTRCNLATLSPLYATRQIAIYPDILRDESLELFKAFFQDPKNDYWRDSLLSEYTLRQPSRSSAT